MKIKYAIVAILATMQFLAISNAQLITKGGMMTGKYVYQEELDKFIVNLKKLQIEADTPDDIIAKVGSPNEKNKIGDSENWIYSFLVSPDGDVFHSTQVTTLLEIGAEGKLLSINVEKNKSGKREVIFSKGVKLNSTGLKASNNNEASHITNSTAPLETPKSGQIYFNTTDSHFYGWNGTEWLQLDNTKN